MSITTLVVLILVVLWCPVYWILLKALLIGESISFLRRSLLCLIAPLVPIAIIPLVWLFVIRED